MCAATTAVLLVGNELSWMPKVTVPPPVIAPAESRGTLNVMVVVPRAVDSALVTGGTSLAALSCAENTIGPVFDGCVRESSSQAAASASTAIRIATRFISSLQFLPGGFAPPDPLARSLARRFVGALRSRGSLTAFARLVPDQNLRVML